MNGDPAEEKDAAREPDKRRPTDRLALLYEGILTAIVRVQSGRQQIQGSDSFRSRMKSALDEIARAAAQRGYTAEDVKEASFAIIAFLDEAVLTSSDSGRTQWARKTLQEEMFNQRSAGELFFQHLDQLRAHRDSPHLAQVLEVYYLCLLLGYEGKYAVGSKAELHLLMDNLRERVERIAGRLVEFSPDAQLPPQRTTLIEADPLPRKIRILALATAVFALLCFLGFKFSLSSGTEELHTVVREVSRPWM